MMLCPGCSAPCGESHKFCFACGAELGAAARSVEDPLLGRTLPGGYRVTHMVGVGGMGRVYCAEQVALGRTVAVKVVHPHLADDELAAARFLNEARTASRLGHPNSVAIFDFGRTEAGQPYIVMEYLRGRDLARVADDEGPLPLRRIVDVMRQTLAALEEAHALGIVHRDLKPDNVVLEPLRSGVDFVKVVDFGLAKILEEAPSSHGGALTRPGLVCGTPEYMSPEQGRGDPLDGRSDLYSLGVVIFELLAGRVPFAADTATKTLLLHLNEPAPDPRSVAPDRAIPAPFAELTLRALAKPREDRFQDAREMASALDDALVAVEGRISRPSPTTGTRCRACGALSPIGQKFCGDCGVSIVTVPPPQPATTLSPSPPPARVTTDTDAVGATLHRGEAVGSGAHVLPLLARADVLEWLETRRHDAEAMLATAHVIGDAGSGKTRLLTEFLSRCTSRGDIAFSTAPDSTWSKVADTSVRDTVRALAFPQTDPQPDAWASASPAARLGLEILLGDVRHGVAVSAQERRRAVAEALRWALERAAERGAGAVVVVVVDDLDYLDGTSRNAFLDVIGEPPVVGALLVLAYAPTANVGLDPLEGESWKLAPLPPDVFRHMLPSRLGTDPHPMLPLHVEQLLSWAQESREAPPERLADLIARRAERLAPDARSTLHALAICGDDVSTDYLPTILAPGVDLPSALKLLERGRMIVLDRNRIRIAHPLVRRVVFSSIPAGRKRELFVRTEGLRADAPIEVRAKQAMHGGSALEALSLLDMLSQRRAAQGDLTGAVSALRHALDVTRRELHRDDLDDPVAAMLVFARKLAESLAASGQWNDAEGVLREALGNAAPTSEHRARLLAVLAHVARARSHPQDARRYLDEAMRVARQSDHRGLMPMLEELEKSIEVA